jgi:hypothetical protein
MRQASILLVEDELLIRMMLVEMRSKKSGTGSLLRRERQSGTVSSETEKYDPWSAC